MCAKRVLALASLVLLLGISACGQKNAKPATDSTPSSAAGGAAGVAPTVDQIISHYQQAVGGRAAWQKLKSRSSMGTIDVPSMNLSGTVVIHEKAPDKMLTIIIIAGSAFRQGFDGTVGWAEDPQDGLREQTGAELAEAKRQSDFYSPFDLHHHYSKLVSRARKKWTIATLTCSKPRLRKGASRTSCIFDAQSGLPVRIVSQHHTPEGVSEFREEFSDYREVDGVKLPFTISQESADSAFTVRISEVRHDVEFEDSEFAKPAVQ